ncbi:MAG: thiaminase II [Alphaproteobacteria bacterium]|jgi:thiaminase/transcriptional activator TenA|nr:thiaminase II [Alphaproteobacteria bacterium]
MGTAADHALAPPESLFERLKAAAAEDWRAYVAHPFVERLSDGSLPEACFRHYLGQDYLFLIHFARAYALAIYKSETLAEMRQAAAIVQGLLDVEMSLHVEYCAGWGMSEAEMEALPEATATMAYTRYVLEKGLSGDILDLYTALAPCVVGYGEIGARLAASPAVPLADNPYRAWIEMYAGDEYREVAVAAVAQLDYLAEARLTEARFPALARTFAQATRLEAAFWQMGLALES